jgi:hypothetical protein
VSPCFLADADKMEARSPGKGHPRENNAAQQETAQRRREKLSGRAWRTPFAAPSTAVQLSQYECPPNENSGGGGILYIIFVLSQF